MHPVAFVSLATLLALPCVGQITVSVHALTPLTATATVGTQQVSTTTPIGPVGSSDLVAADLHVLFAGEAHMALWWDTTVTNTATRFEWHQYSTLSEFPTVPVSASTTSCDLLVMLQSVNPVHVQIDVERIVQASAGATLPTNRIDIGNDGHFDFLETSSMPGTVAADIGPQPLLFLVRSETFGTGAVNVMHRITVRPDHTLVATAAGSCAGDLLRVQPTFVGTGIQLASYPANPLDLSIGVLGLGMQPLLFPSPTGMPCLVVPSADLTVLLFPHVPFDLAIPASVRPLDLWVQAVTLQPFGPASTDGHHVFAY